MNRIEHCLFGKNTDLYTRLENAKNEVALLLKEYSRHFPTYTDHSLVHTQHVFDLVCDLLNPEELNNLSYQELYILGMSSLLHDVGMCIPEQRLAEISSDKKFTAYKQKHPEKNTDEIIRDLHHEFSYDFIMNEYEKLQIPTERYAQAIALVAKGHRKEDLLNFDIYKSKFFVQSGRDFVCLPYLAALLRLADELDVTNSRTPDLLTKYYLPNNDQSRIEWEKHRSTILVYMDNDTVTIEAKANDQNLYNALRIQFSKIEEVIEYCQKVIRNLGNTNEKKYSLSISKIKISIKSNFTAKNIKFSIDVSSVINTLMGASLYQSELVPVRELIQNALDSCLYKKTFIEGYEPKIIVNIDSNVISCEDNGLGMDEYIIDKYFSRLSSSFYQGEKLNSDYQSIGKFGIGVFSYFTISEYIEVETKKKDKEPLRFRADKNPENYFYFFEESTKESEGTKVSLNLNEGFKQKKLNDIVDYIYKTFKYINVDLLIKFDFTELHLRTPNFNLVASEFVECKIHPHYRKLFVNVEIIEHQFSNQECEGVLLFYPSFKYHDMDDYDICLKQEYSSHSAPIAIYSRGIFIQEIEPNFLNRTLGAINYKNGIELNLSRNQIKDQIVWELFAQQSIIIAQKYIVKLKQEMSPYDAWIHFSENYLRYFRTTSFDIKSMDELVNFVLEHCVMKLLDSNIEREISIDDIYKYHKYHLVSDYDLGKTIISVGSPIIVFRYFDFTSVILSALRTEEFLLSYEQIGQYYVETYTATDAPNNRIIRHIEKYDVYEFAEPENLCFAIEFCHDRRFKNLDTIESVLNGSHSMIKDLMCIINSVNTHPDEGLFAERQLSNLKNLFDQLINKDDVNDKADVIKEIRELTTEINEYYTKNYVFSPNKLQDEILLFLKSIDVDFN